MPARPPFGVSICLIYGHFKYLKTKAKAGFYPPLLKKISVLSFLDHDIGKLGRHVLRFFANFTAT